MEENANKLHLQCTDFVSAMRVTVHAECIYAFLFLWNLFLVAQYHVDCDDMGVASNRQEEAIASSWNLQIIQRPGWSIAENQEEADRK